MRFKLSHRIIRTTSVMLLVLTASMHIRLQAQTSSRNYVMSEQWLDSAGQHVVKTVQYYDGLGRPVQAAIGGVHPQGEYLHTLTEYDVAGRESREWLPAVSVSGLGYSDSTVLKNKIRQTNGGYPYSQTTYDALGRVTSVTRPGSEWHQNGMSVTKEYITNGENDVRKFRILTTTSIAIYPDGYHPAGTLTGERTTDEDGVSLTVFHDLACRVLLERRGGGNDTYFVYDTGGRLRFMLQPKHEQTNSPGFRFVYRYDDYGRVISKTYPGCDPTNYRYDRSGRLCFERDARLKSRGLCRFRLYDPLGRPVLTGTTTLDGISLAGDSYEGVTTLASSGGICGTGYACPAGLALTDVSVEEAVYYDSYSFLSLPLFSAATQPQEMGLQGTSEGFTQSLVTGRAVTDTKGQTLLSAIYYDREGRVTDMRELRPGGWMTRTVTSYTYTGQVAQATETLYPPSGWSYGVRTSYAYSTVTDKLSSKTLEVTTNGNSSFTEHYRYDALGRCVCDSVHHFKQTLRTYEQHGWLTSSQTLRMNGAYTIEHAQQLRYTNGAHPCYSGRISAVNTYTGGAWKGFNLEYDSLGRMVNAEGTIREDMLAQGAAHSESLEYDANGNITVLSRYGTYGGEFGQTDFLQMSYAGNRLTGVYDVVGQPVSAGTFGFRNGTGQNRYGYDKCGSLLHDANRGIALIDYDDRGMPVRIQFTDGSVTEHVYASDGRRLRMRHLTAVEGLSVALKSRHELTESETLSKDSVDYMGNFQVIGNRVRRFDFADGYATYRQNVPAEVLDFHFFVRGHQGSVTAVIGRESAEQLTRYYPFGGLMTQDCMGEGVSADKYTGKRLDRMHGLDWYDFGARQYDPVYGRFAGIDPLCEKYPHLSPYAYCGNDPVNFVDPTGCIFDLSQMNDKEREKYNNQVEKQKENSRFFRTMYSALEESKDIYNVSYGEVLSSKGENIYGIFVKNENGGGKIIYSNKYDDIPDYGFIEELFHAYQHNYKTGYEKGVFNREYEAKLFTYISISEYSCAMFPLGDTGLADKLILYQYGDFDNNIMLSPQWVKSSVFLSDYITTANNYARYNIEHNVGNDNYKKMTSVAPYGLQKVILDTYTNIR